MEIFIEDCLLQNFLLLYFALSSAKCITKEKKQTIFDLFSCVVGSVFIVFFAVIKTTGILNLIAGLAITILVCFLSLGKDKANNLILYISIFIMFKYLYIGIGEGLSRLFEWKISGNLLVAVLFVCFVWCKKAISQFYKKRKLNHFYYNLRLVVMGKGYDITAYLDSGNLLQDNATGLPILVLDLDTFLKIFEDKISVVDILQKRLDSKLSGKYISCQTTHGMGKMFVCEIDGIYSKESKMANKELHALVGFGNFGFAKKDCQGLLSPLAL
ncbi:MAG: sigma-E processing peptidase SpoIIGA [Christensenellales bacterium]